MLNTSRLRSSPSHKSPGVSSGRFCPATPSPGLGDILAGRAGTEALSRPLTGRRRPLQPAGCHRHPDPPESHHDHCSQWRPPLHLLQSRLLRQVAQQLAHLSATAWRAPETLSRAEKNASGQLTSFPAPPLLRATLTFAKQLPRPAPAHPTLRTRPPISSPSLLIFAM